MIKTITVEIMVSFRLVQVTFWVSSLTCRKNWMGPTDGREEDASGADSGAAPLCPSPADAAADTAWLLGVDRLGFRRFFDFGI